MKGYFQGGSLVLGGKRNSDGITSDQVNGEKGSSDFYIYLLLAHILKAK